MFRMRVPTCCYCSLSCVKVACSQSCRPRLVKASGCAMTDGRHRLVCACARAFAHRHDESEKAIMRCGEWNDERIWEGKLFCYCSVINCDMLMGTRGRCMDDVHLTGFVLKWQPQTAHRKEHISCIRNLQDGHWDVVVAVCNCGVRL
jgi:hypothetical protein